MSRFIPIASWILAAALLVACPPPEGQETATASGEDAQQDAGGLQTEDEKILYTMGHMLSRGVSSLALEEGEVEVLLSGFRDATQGVEPKVDLREYGGKLQAFARTRRDKAASREKEASQAFVLAAVAEEGAEETESGLVYREIVAGAGESPEASDHVKVHYHGTLRTGEVFDSSVDRGEPAVFPLNRVIPCWTEALQKMKPGGKAHIVCPSDIAYGDQGSPSGIAPGAALAFDVELLEVVPTDAPPDAPTPAPDPGEEPAS